MSAPDHDWFPTHLRVTVIRARGLRPKGKNGLNKCYTVIQLGEEKFVTSVKEGTLNPEWKEQCSLQLPLVLDSSDKWVLHLVVKQSNAVTPDKFLGHVSLPVVLLYEDKTKRKDEWYSLISKPNKAVKNRGQLQLTFQFLRDNMTASSYELSKAGPQSVFNKFKEKVASIKYGVNHDLIPSVRPAISWNNSENPKLQKSRSYVRMDSNAETKPTFHLPAMSKTEEPETPSDHFHNLHKKSDDAEFKMHLTMEDSLFDTGGTQINNQIFHTGTINLIEALRLESRHNEAVVDPMLDPPLKDKISSNLADLKGGNQSITFQGIVPLRSIAKVDDNTNKDGGDVWQSEQMCPIFCYHCFGNINPKLR